MLPVFLTTYRSPSPKRRYGRDGDGGYVIADGFSYDRLITAGISDDVSFEADFLRGRGIPCDAFDGTVEGLPEKLPNTTFHRSNVGPSNDLTDILGSCSNAFLKVDIEGCEFEWLESLPDNAFEGVLQMVIEFHLHTERLWGDKNAHRMIHRCGARHHLIHLHANNCLPLGTMYGMTVPRVFECTFLRHDCFSTVSPSPDVIPGFLDRKNVPGNGPDHALRGWPYGP